MANAVGRAPEGGEPGRLGLPFWRLWSASGLSNLADGLVKIALPLVAVTLTDSPGLVAGVTLAVTLPWLLFALPAGALADRVDRRLAMVTANVVRAAAVAVLAVTLVLGLESSPAAIWALYAVALLLGTAETVYDTCAQSILPQVVSRDRLPRANGRLIAAELTANEFVGPPLGACWWRPAWRPPSQPRPRCGRPRSGPCCCCEATSPFHEPRGGRPSGPTWPKGCAICGGTGCCAPWPP
jgi:MFS family permease